MANEPLPIVEVRGASITFPGVKALDEVNFRLLPGEVHTLMGENGAGKSTLIKALTGVYQIDSGSILVFGTERRFSGTASAQAAGISTVYQEVNLCTNLTIGENVMLGHETRGLVGINWRKTHARAHEVLADMGLGDLDTRAPLSSISIALQQLVAISRAMVTKSKVLILDEPTSSLDAAEVEMLFGVMRRLRDQGVAILFVSHFLDQVYAISDRITVLRNGGFVGEYLKRDLDRTELISKMIGKDINALRALGSNRQVDERDRTQTPVYAADELGRKGSLTPTDIEIHKGEVVGFAGLLGSGRTELARLIFGAPFTWELPQLQGFNFRGGWVLLPELVALTVALSLYTAAFIAETVRAGIQSVPRGQIEAAIALGLTPRQRLRLIVLPQAMRVIIPPLTSQYLNLTKNSSLGAAIGYPDLVMVSNTTMNQTGQAIEGIAIFMLVYLGMSITISMLMNWYNARVALVER